MRAPFGIRLRSGGIRPYAGMLPCEKAAEQMNVEQQAWAVRKALEKLAWMKEHIE